MFLRLRYKLGLLGGGERHSEQWLHQTWRGDLAGERSYVHQHDHPSGESPVADLVDRREIDQFFLCWVSAACPTVAIRWEEGFVPSSAAGYSAKVSK